MTHKTRNTPVTTWEEFADAGQICVCKHDRRAHDGEDWIGPCDGLVKVGRKWEECKCRMFRKADLISPVVN